MRFATDVLRTHSMFVKFVGEGVARGFNHSDKYYKPTKDPMYVPNIEFLSQGVFSFILPIETYF